MAPSRRRGAGKAAAAAAARHQWKDGDLVLAKVKGFPAWPAVVSEPKKWGYKTDRKKVFVYFFGTQQIAFCNPVDVEAFTEEKKQSLLTKRQGKGADFVRAMQEIIDIYENLKKQDQVDELNSGPDLTLANGGNSVLSSAHIECRIETSETTTTGGNDNSVPVDVTQDVVQTGSLHEKEALAEQHNTNMAVPEKSIIATYTSRKRSGGLRSRKNTMEKKGLSGERSRSSSQLESAGFQNLMMPSSDAKKSAWDASYSVMRDRSLWRNKRSRKSPEEYEWDDEDSSAFVSNCSIEDNGSEIVTVDSDSFSLNEGSTVDSECRPEHSGTFAECLDGDVQLSKGIDVQVQAVVVKKKRKLNRKHAYHEASEPMTRLETDDQEVGLSNSGQKSHANSNERYNKEDGDKHLPLVKRARVRMEKPVFLDEEDNNVSQAEEKKSIEGEVNLPEVHNGLSQDEDRTSLEAVVDRLEPAGPSENCTNNCSCPGDSSMGKAAINNLSPLMVSAQIAGDRPLLLRVKENPSFGSSADDEAALPPSKRLHRALEAMSANAAEESEVIAETSTVKTPIKGCSVPPGSSFQLSTNSKEISDSAGQSAEDPGDGVSALFSCLNTTLKESSKLPPEAEIVDQIGECPGRPETKDVFTEGMDHDDDKDCGTLSASCPTVPGHSLAPFMSDVDVRQITPPSNHGSLDKDEGHSEDIMTRYSEAENIEKELGVEKQCGSMRRVDEAPKAASENFTIVDLRNTEDITCEKTKSFRSQIWDNSLISDMSALEKDGNYDMRQKETSHVSVSDNNSIDKYKVGTQASPSRADGVESPARLSPSTTPIGHVSTSESANNIQNASCSSPNIYSDKTTTCSSVANGEKIESVVSQRSNSTGKGSSAEALATLSSFEGMLGSLTRTKDSIGRATRLAIDCAKFGMSVKVVEILSCALENEANLHRRVDFFFLVDSIAQCSRGLRGDCGAYPSAIQAVLPRLLSAAAPPGSHAYENRRQCLKVLRLWLERKILPESVVRRHMRELDSLGYLTSAGPYSRRSARTERALDDPVRDMEGMLVDEYGSNSSFQLPGFCMPCMLKDDDGGGSDSDGGSFEAVTPERNSETSEQRERPPAMEKHTRILEEVDGELEMEDVAPSCEAEMTSTSGITGVNVAQSLHAHFEQRFPMPFSLPQNVQPSSPPFPPSPPPPPPPPAAVAAPTSAMTPDRAANDVDSKLYANRQDMQDELRQSVPQQSVVPRMNQSTTSAVRFHAPECRDPMRICDSNNSRSSYSVHHIQHNDGPSFHRNPYPPRPPHPPPSNHFSYVQSGQHMKSRREAPPPAYSHRYHSSHSFDGGNFYDNHERTRPAPYEPPCENWRFHAPPFPAPRNPYKNKGSYSSAPYGGPPREPNRLHRQDWEFHSHGMHHRHFMPFRPHSGGAIPVANRASGTWRPR